MDPSLLRQVARRAASRVARDQDRPAPPPTHIDVFVAERPAAGSEPDHLRPEPPLVTEACLARIEDGGLLAVSPRARVTPAAAEAAHRRGIRLVASVPSAAGGLREERRARRVAVASDHGGFALKGALLESLRELGHMGLDLGPADERATDWPQRAHDVALAVAEERAELGIVIDAVGIGSAMAANKVPGVRAANCWNEAVAKNAREHNHANVLVLGARHLTALVAHRILVAFLDTPLGEGRHARRAAMLDQIEARHGGQRP